MTRKLDEQIEMAKALSEGRSFAVKRIKRVLDAATGLHRKVEVDGRARQWWFLAENGKVALQLRYGSRVIMLTKNRNAVEVGSSAELLSVLQTLKTAVSQGELDQEIAVAADMVRARFDKK